ncbi:MAG: hypothetical protein HKP12_01770 [Gammaproteobacteria bacterium]|nr:hypothetical protein [Gammaproteobacteria bacterium]NNJ95870.1 hypothetical protein [Gammaproteobacteria bacterium]
MTRFIISHGGQKTTDDVPSVFRLEKDTRMTATDTAFHQKQHIDNHGLV